MILNLVCGCQDKQTIALSQCCTMSKSVKQKQTAFIQGAVDGVMDEGGVNVIVINNRDLSKILKNATFTAKWDCLDSTLTESLAHMKVTECVLQWCAIHIFRIDHYNELRVALVKMKLLDDFLATVEWKSDVAWEKLQSDKRCPEVIMGRSLFYQPVQMPFVKMLLDSMANYITRFTPVPAPEPELEPEVERAMVVENVQTVAELPAEVPAEVKTPAEKALEAELRQTKHDLHVAKRVVFQLKDLCEMKDTFFYKQEKRQEELLKHAFDQAKAFTALYEANEEAQEEAQEEKPWHDDDVPEGFFSWLQDSECDWLDGEDGDVSVTSSDPSDSEEDIDNKMLAEPVVWTDEDEKRLAELKALNSGAIPVDADILNELIEKKMRSKWA